MVAQQLSHDPHHWCDRAAQMRALADTVNDAETKTVMLKLADEYDRLADRAEKRRGREGCEKIILRRSSRKMLRRAEEIE